VNIALTFARLISEQRLFGTLIPPDLLLRLENAKPAWPIRQLMDRFILLALLPGHPDILPGRRLSPAG